MGDAVRTDKDAADAPSSPRPLETIVDRLSGGYRSMEAMVYQILREGILTGTFAPGERLHQERLALTIGVSRVPVRTALVQLEGDGLVQFVPRKGAVVTTLTPAQVDEIYDVRELLEITALRKAGQSITPERLAQLREIVVNVDIKDEELSFVDSRRAFYRLLYDAETNPLLYSMIEDLRLKVGRYQLRPLQHLPHRHTHQEIVELVAAGRLEDAVEALLEHLRSSRQNVLRMLTPES